MISDTQGYAEAMFPTQPHLSPLISSHTNSTSPHSLLGPYWIQPGRSIVEARLDPLPFPVKPVPNSHPELLPLEPSEAAPSPAQITEPDIIFRSDAQPFDTATWDANSAVRIQKHPDGRDWLMRKTFGMRMLEKYIRSLSAWLTYLEKHPEEVRAHEAYVAGKGGEGDAVDRMMAKIKADVEGDEIEVGWPLTLMMIKKKG